MSEFGKSFEKLEGMNISEKTGGKIEIDKRSDDIFGRIFDDDFPAEKSDEKIEPHLSADPVRHESAAKIFDRIFADDLPAEKQNADAEARAPADMAVKAAPDKIFDGIFADDRHSNGDIGGLRDGESAESFASDETGGKNVEVPEKKGGSYSEVKATGSGEIHEVHHVPADSASPLERGDGPAIKMERADHRLTASYGGSGINREDFLRFEDASSSEKGPNNSHDVTLNGTTYYFDDKEKLYRVGKELLPNCSYEINGYTYKTDWLGRIISASGRLHLKTREERLQIRDSIEDIGKGDQKENDDRGHLIGDQFDGSNGLENMIPQDSKVNRNDFKMLENELAAECKQGKEVYASVEPLYKSDSQRPDAVVVSYKIDGKESIRSFPN